MHIDAFDYELPETAIAQTPLAVRDASRLLVGGTSGVEHRHVRDMASLVGPGDVIVVNNTRVLPARIKLFKPTGGGVEVFLLEERPGGSGDWEALVRPSKKTPPGMVLRTEAGEPVMRAGEDLGAGRRVISPIDDRVVREIADAHGQVPTPPYVREALADPERYQTVYAERELSVAAPTAGLHFTPALLDACRATGAEIHTVELAVGIGTFRPITVEDIAEHDMHAEGYHVSATTWAACQNAQRVIAIGTTSVRALESAATFGEPDGNGDRYGKTELFISPGYEWKVVDALLTNFHQPRSSLLVMLAAFAGPGWRDLYAEALSAGYRFLSFGDAMLIARAGLTPGQEVTS